MEGFEGLGPKLTAYHFNMVGKHTCVKPGASLNVCGVGVDITGSLHSDRTAVGFKFHTSDGIISYVCDTNFREDIMNESKGSRVIILPVTRPTRARIKCHLCTEDVIKYADAIKPELIIFTHMGVRMIHDGPEEEAAHVEKATGVRTIAAKDLMKVCISQNIRISKVETL
jgi:phosphoribosyl 1,2-cyclic phosphodiesterase